MPRGQPTKYTEDIPEKVQAYIDSYKEQGDLIPSIAGLAVYLDVSRETVHAWARGDKHPDYSDMLRKLLAMQERVLLTGGLSNDYNSTITKLVLSKHGYSDKVDHSSEDGSMKPEKIEIVSPKEV